MSKIFSKDERGKVHLKRNKVPKNFVVQGTTDFGTLTPVACMEMVPGDTIELSPEVFVKSHPVVFPVQTRMRGYMNFFVVRNRILYKDWPDFITNTKDGLTPPWLRLNNSRAKQMISTGSLGDYLNVPSTVAGVFPSSNPAFGTPLVLGVKPTATTFHSLYNSFEGLKSYYTDKSVVVEGADSNPSVADFFAVSASTSEVTASSSDVYAILIPVNKIENNIPTTIYGSNSSSLPTSYTYVGVARDLESGNMKCETITVSVNAENQNVIDFSSMSQFDAELNDFYILCSTTAESTQFFTTSSYTTYTSLFGDFFGASKSKGVFSYATAYYNLAQILDSTDDSVIASNKFVGNQPAIPLQALKFRAYECIYNYFFRNDVNNPYKPDGTNVEYNKYIPSTDGGPDDNLYVLRKRNWELDAYTSASQSPQFGIAPLVGLSYSPLGNTADLSFQGTDSQGNTRSYSVKVGVTPDGEIESIVDYDKDTPSGNLRELINLSNTGFSINDLRNVNKWTKYKEHMLAKGSYRYHDQLQTHFGIAPDYPDIDVPEYIGGFSGDLVSSQVQNMAEGAAPLGDIAGRIDARFGAKNKIRYTAHEHCFVMGIFSIVPIPTYSQLLDKAFLRTSSLDYFTPEFAHIGKQPITRAELMPLQSSNVNEVFGYQKPWYDYLMANDEIHGDFRTNLNDFVINRVFASEPQLNEEFTLVDNDSLNNIWAVDDRIVDKYQNSKKFMFTVVTNGRMLRPIPVTFSPSLE